MNCIEKLTSNANQPRLVPTFKQPERKLLSVFMALIEFSDTLRQEFLSQCGCGLSKAKQYESHMEVSYSGVRFADVRPDGLMVCTRGKAAWSAFIEAKAEQNKIRTDQIQEYCQLAESLDVDAVVTISNEFALRPSEPPYSIADGKKKGRSLYHFAWAEIRTFLELNRSNPALSPYELYVLDQCLHFFWEDTSGVKTFDSMPENWPAFVESSSTTLGFNSNIKGFSEIVFGWQQERRDLCSKLTHELNRPILLRHAAGVRSSLDDRLKLDRQNLADDYVLEAKYYFEDEKLSLDAVADLRACKFSTSFEIPLPSGKGCKALVSWLLKATSELEDCDVQLYFDWPGTKNDISIGLDELKNDPEKVTLSRRDAPRKVLLTQSKHSVRRFKSRKLSIEDFEGLVFSSVDVCRKSGWLQ